MMWEHSCINLKTEVIQCFLEHLHHPIMKPVFVPFMRIINFTGVLSKMLLNCILFTFTRKMETNWLSARLVNFPLSFFHGYKLESQLAFLNRFFFPPNLDSVLQILDKGHMLMNIRCSLKVPLCSTNYQPWLVVSVVFLCTPLWVSVSDYQMADRDLGWGIVPAWGQSSGISSRNHSSTEKPQQGLNQRTHMCQYH